MSEPERPPLPKRPYRDSLILNLVLAALIIVISWVTGGEPGRAFVFAGLYLILATAWTWWRLRQRISREQP